MLETPVHGFDEEHAAKQNFTQGSTGLSRGSPLSAELKSGQDSITDIYRLLPFRTFNE
jgi:hypothetical protein